MAEVVGLIASISEILGVLLATYRKAKRGPEAIEKLERVKEQVMVLENIFKDELHCRARYTPEVLGVADTQLCAVRKILQSISINLPVAPPNSSKLLKLRSRVSLLCFGLRRGGSVNKKLDNVIVKLESAFQEIMLIMVPVARYPFITMLPEGNPISVGLDRAIDVLQFLGTPSSQAASLPSSSSAITIPPTRPAGLHIVGIVGQGGLGKYTLLIHILREVQQSQHAFDIMAYVELVNESLDNRAVRELQSSLLCQLGGLHSEFHTSRVGKSKLRERFEMLQRSGSSVCIAINNVWRAQDLEELLPDRFATSLPSLNICIMITSRVRSIVRNLSGHCGGNPRVLCFEPQILPDTASRELLLAHANLGGPSHVLPEELRLIEDIFPFCGGLPLALRLAGSLFAQRREAQYWEEWMNDMEPGRSGVPLQHIDRILELSYKNLPPRSQEALLDIGACLGGWRWEAVQGIVGSLQLENLKDFSLIDCVKAQGLRTNEQVVRMHDLIRKLAAAKRDNSEIIIWDPDTWSTSLLLDESIHRSIRFLRLNVEKAEEPQLLNSPAHLLLDGSYFARMKKLQVLDVFGSFRCTQLLLPVSLRFLKLEWNRYLTEANIPSRLQQLELRGCASLKELPTSIYECGDLRYLCIVGCPRLQGFRPDTKWKKLSTLWLEECARITTLPSDLVELKWLTVIDCERVLDLPSLYNNLRSEDVNISGCPCRWPLASSMLHQPLSLSSRSSESVLPLGNAGPTPKKRIFSNVSQLQRLLLDELNALENLTIRECDDVQALWLVLVNMVSLKKMKLQNCGCSQLEELPDEMHNLTKLKLLYFQQLRTLPDGICNLDLLVVLSLRGCAQLQELPREIGNLVALETLELDGCQSLVRLPDSLCQLERLKELDMTRCSKLVRLPQEMGNMRSLINLRLGNCSSLQMLPDSICELKSLKELNMTWCAALETLPENLGNLSSLRNLRLGNCSSLERLPDSICNSAHLSLVLDLEGCPQLSEQVQGH